MAELKKNKKIASATHNILAYRSAVLMGNILLHFIIIPTSYQDRIMPIYLYICLIFVVVQKMFL